MLMRFLGYFQLFRTALRTPESLTLVVLIILEHLQNFADRDMLSFPKSDWLAGRQFMNHQVTMQEFYRESMPFPRFNTPGFEKNSAIKCFPIHKERTRIKLTNNRGLPASLIGRLESYFDDGIWFHAPRINVY